MSFPLLSLIIFFPIVAGLLVNVIPSQWARTTAICVAAVELLGVVFCYYQFSNVHIGYQFFENFDWFSITLGSYGKLVIEYALGIDGISLVLVVMSSIVFLIAILASGGIIEKQKSYYSLTLILMGTVMGCFLALDFFLFFIFFEFMLLPMYFLIGIWGGERRAYASIKFFLYTLFGSILILMVMIMLYTSAFNPHDTAHSFTMNIFQYLLNTNVLPSHEYVHTLRLDYLADPHNYVIGSILHVNQNNLIGWFTYREWAFLLLLIGFIIKLPAFPFHTWLPDTHVEAPTAVSVILAAVLLKIGAYGIIRIAIPLFPSEAISFAPLLAGVGMISIVYGAYLALAQNDLKKLVAYSSISHMGFVLLGIASFEIEGLSGAVYQLVSHGFISAALFLIVGVIYDRTHNRNISNFSGIAFELPNFTVMVVIVFFASLGLPGLSGFIAEILVLMGSFESDLVPNWIVLTSLFGLILTAGYYLWTLQRMFFGKFWIHESLSISRLNPLSRIEYMCLIPLVILIIVLGVYPSLLLNVLNTTIGVVTQKGNGIF